MTEEHGLRCALIELGPSLHRVDNRAQGEVVVAQKIACSTRRETSEMSRRAGDTKRRGHHAMSFTSEEDALGAMDARIEVGDLRDVLRDHYN